MNYEELNKSSEKSRFISFRVIEYHRVGAQPGLMLSPEAMFDKKNNPTSF